MFVYHVDEKIKLKILQRHHAGELFQLVDHSREHLSEWMPWTDKTQEEKDTLGFIENALEKLADGTEFHCGIWFEGQLAGVIGYHSMNAALKIGEIGYWLGKDFEGKGIMTKSTAALIRYGFEELGLNKIEITCAVKNLRSQMIPQRLGFQQEGIRRQATLAGSRVVDLMIFGKLVSDETE